VYLYPEAPSYEDQINARDNLLKMHPKLDFTGTHLASLEWCVDEVVKRLDEFPNLKVDLSARMAHLQLQSIPTKLILKKNIKCFLKDGEQTGFIWLPIQL